MRKKINMSDILSVIAIVIAVGGLFFTYMQAKTIKSQLRLNELQIRPYVKYIPRFSVNSKKKIEASMYLENLSSVPAKIVYTQLTPWVDGSTSGIFVKSTSPDILYEHKGGLAPLPPITGKLARKLIAGQSDLMIGSCVVYGSISPSDSRRWEVRALYSYERDTDLPTTQYTQELEVSASQSICDSANIRMEWLQQKAQAGRSKSE